MSGKENNDKITSNVVPKNIVCQENVKLSSPSIPLSSNKKASKEILKSNNVKRKRDANEDEDEEDYDDGDEEEEEDDDEEDDSIVAPDSEDIEMETDLDIPDDEKDLESAKRIAKVIQEEAKRFIKKPLESVCINGRSLRNRATIKPPSENIARAKLITEAFLRDEAKELIKEISIWKSKLSKEAEAAKITWPNLKISMPLSQIRKEHEIVRKALGLESSDDEESESEPDTDNESASIDSESESESESDSDASESTDS